MNIKVVDTIIPPYSSKKMGYIDKSSTNKNPYYRVWMYLEGPDLPYVEKVTYVLHSTFNNPLRSVNRTPANPNCSVDIWTWGIFTVKVIIEDKRGDTTVIHHRLMYDRLLNEVELVQA